MNLSHGFQFALAMLTLALPTMALRATPAPALLTDQQCGKSQLGGIVPSGNYAGSGSSCQAARDALHTNMGAPLPTCAHCSHPEQCTPSVTFSPPGNVVEGNCYFDSVTSLWVVPAAVSASTRWDSVCSSCDP